MPVYNVTINITEDGAPLPGFPLVKSKTVTESGGKQTYSRPDAAATWTELALTDLGQINVLFVQLDQAYNMRFQDQTDEGLDMNANGIILLIDAAIPSGAALKAAVENGSGSAATVTQVAGGS